MHVYTFIVTQNLYRMVATGLWKCRSTLRPTKFVKSETRPCKSVLKNIQVGHSYCSDKQEGTHAQLKGGTPDKENALGSKQLQATVKCGPRDTSRSFDFAKNGTLHCLKKKLEIDMKIFQENSVIKYW